MAAASCSAALASSPRALSSSSVSLTACLQAAAEAQCLFRAAWARATRRQGREREIGGDKEFASPHLSPFSTATVTALSFSSHASASSLLSSSSSSSTALAASLTAAIPASRAENASPRERCTSPSSVREEMVSCVGARGGGRRRRQQTEQDEEEEAKDGDGDGSATPLPLTLAAIFSMLDVEQDREEGDGSDDENAELALYFHGHNFFLVKKREKRKNGFYFVVKGQ